MASLEAIILLYVCPAIGVVVMQAMWIAPYRAIESATERLILEPLNPLPWVFMVATCFGWLVYSSLIQNLWIFLGNVCGFILGVYYCLQAIKLQFQGHHSGHFKTSLLEALEAASGTFAEDDSSEDKEEGRGVLDYAQIIWNVASLNTPVPSSIENFVLFAVVFWTTIVAGIVFIPLPKYVKVTVVGCFVVSNLVLLFAAPLSTIAKIVRTRSSASIHRPTMWANLVKAVVWFAYGLAINDLFVALPNLAGLLLSLAQVVLLMVFPNSVESDDKATVHKTRNKSSPLDHEGSTTQEGTSDPSFHHHDVISSACEDHQKDRTMDEDFDDDDEMYI